MPRPDHEVRPGDIFQIVESHGRAGWIGAFVLVSEVKSWGIQGFVHMIQTHDQAARAYIRLKWDEIEYVGRAVLVPGDEVQGEPEEGDPKMEG